MGSQLHASPRRLQPTPEERTQQCISRVSSENLVSPLHFTGQTDRTHGFVTRNEPDTLGVITQFVSHEKTLLYPGELVNNLHSRLQETKGNLEFSFPAELMAGRYLLMECKSVSVERCASDQYTIKFGCGFEDPDLCSKIRYPALPIKQLLFEPECISQCDGLKAFCESAAVRALHTHLGRSNCAINPSDNCSLVFDYKDTYYSAAIKVFEFILPAIRHPLLRTKQGLLVIPHADMKTHYQTYVVSISVTPKPHGNVVTSEDMCEGVSHVGSLLKDGMDVLFRANSPNKLRSVSDFID